MASSRDTSNGPDVVDVTAVMSAFQGMNRVHLTWEASVVDDGQYSYMLLEATAWTIPPEDGDQKPSVLLSVRERLASNQTMETAILQLLYRLDFRLAESEWEKPKKGE